MAVGEAQEQSQVPWEGAAKVYSRTMSRKWPQQKIQGA